MRIGALNALPGYFAADNVTILHEYTSDVFAGISLLYQTTDHSFQWARVEERLGALQGASKLWNTMSYYQKGVMRTPPFEDEPKPSSHVDRHDINISLAGRNQDEFSAGDVDINSVHDMTQVSKLHAAPLFLSGKGVRIALVDGGVDYLHPALGGGFGTGFQADYGWDFVGDNVRPPLKENPDPDPFGECSDHATHTAGILFANDTETGFRGVAPGVSIELYRVFDCNGMSTSDVVVRAVLEAYERGVDLINLSLGSGSRPFSDDPLSALVSRINRVGPTFIVTGAGNSGHYGTFSAAAPEGGGPDVFSVGAVDVDHSFSVLRPGRATINNSGSLQIQNFTWNPPTWTAWWRSSFPKSIRLVKIESATGAEDAGDACEVLTPGSELYRGKVVLIQRGGCAFKTKLENLVSAGGQYVLIYDGRPGPVFDLEVRLDDNGIIGAGSLDLETGKQLAALLKDGNEVSLEMDSDFLSPAIIRSHPNTETADRVSTFSSWGPSGEGHFVPTLLGPGGNVLSTLPRQRGGWGIQSGSSMAVPYITGCIALLKEAFPELSCRQIANTLVSTADPLPFNDGTNKTFNFLASAWQQGAGRVNAYRGFQSKTAINTTSLAFNDTEFSTGPIAVSITNLGTDAVEYELSHVPAVTVLSLSESQGDLYPIPFSSAQKAAEATPEFLESIRSEIYAELRISVSRLSLGSGQSSTVKISPKLENLRSFDLASRCPLYSGYLKLSSNKSSERPDLVVPYGGIACEIRSIPTLAVARNTTFLAAATQEDADMASFRSRFAGKQYLQAVPPGHTFQLSKDEDLSAPDAYASVVLPTMQVDLTMYTRAVKFELLPRDSSRQAEKAGEVIPLPESGDIYPVGGFGRVETLFRHWTGILPNGSWASPGEYRIRISTLRLFGDPNNEDFRDQFTTEPFRIKYTADPAFNKYEKMMSIAQAFLESSLDRPCLEQTILTLDAT